MLVTTSKIPVFDWQVEQRAEARLICVLLRPSKKTAFDLGVTAMIPKKIHVE